MKDIYQEIVRKVDEFGPLLNELSALIERVPDDEERKKLRRGLANTMGGLDGEIAYTVRRWLISDGPDD